MGVEMDKMLFVANHAFDCLGAKAAGMRSAFVDRRNRPFGGTPHQPDIWVKDMCSGLMKPDTHLGENARQIEVSDDQTTPLLFR